MLSARSAHFFFTFSSGSFPMRIAWIERLFFTRKGIMPLAAFHGKANQLLFLMTCIF